MLCVTAASSLELLFWSVRCAVRGCVVRLSAQPWWGLAGEEGLNNTYTVRRERRGSRWDEGVRRSVEEGRGRLRIEVVEAKWEAGEWKRGRSDEKEEAAAGQRAILVTSGLVIAGSNLLP